MDARFAGLDAVSLGEAEARRTAADLARIAVEEHHATVGAAIAPVGRENRSTDTPQ